MKRCLLVNVVACGVTWLVLAGLNLLVNRFLVGGLILWVVTGIVMVGAAGDWFGGWLKSR